MRVLAVTLVLLGFVGTCVYGLLFVFSSTMPSLGGADPAAAGGLDWQPVLKQAVFYAMGLGLLLIVARTPYRRWLSLSSVIFGANVVLLILVFAIGSTFGGARSWFALGPLRFQPAETMKIAWVLCLAQHMCYRSGCRTFGAFVAPLFITAVPVGLLLAQPDLGTAAIFLPSLLAILYLCGARKTHLLLAVLLAAAVAVPFYRWGLKDYQQGRILAFLDPVRYEKTYSYQLRQSQMAIGSGHWLGKGLGQGEVNRLALLPDRHTDFIFSVIAEELGFLGALGLLLCYGLLFLGLLLIAHCTREPYGKTLVAGICVVFSLQVFLNIGVAVGLLPTTGITLPLVSAGGSSVIACCLMIGLALSVSRHHVPDLSSPESMLFDG